MTPRLRDLALQATQGPAAGLAAGLLERAVPWRRGRLAIVTYHRVDEPEARPDLMPGLISATPAAFEAHLVALVRHYRPVTLAEVLAANDRPQDLPPRAVLVTFDDAYRDFAAHAWPRLRALGVPATLFVPTGFVGRPEARFWWDRLWSALRATSLPAIETPVGRLDLGSDAARGIALRTLRARIKGLDHDAAMAEVDDLVDRLGEGRSAPATEAAVLDWAELRDLAAEGVTLGLHTRGHPLLERVSRERAVEEIQASRADLEREIGPVLPVLAYPSGAHGGSAVEAAREAGVRLAMTTERGGNDLRRADPLRLRRINVGARTSPALLRAQLAWATGIDARRA